MNRKNWVRFALPFHLAAIVNNLLRTALHFSIATLYGIEIKALRIHPGIHARSRATAETDQHPGAAQLNQQRTGWKLFFECMAFGDMAYASSQHDGLVITTHFTGDALLESPEIPCQIGPSEFVVERRPTNGAFQHNLQSRCDPRWFAVRMIPT